MKLHVFIIFQGIISPEIAAQGIQKSLPNIGITFESQSGSLICKHIPKDAEFQTNPLVLLFKNEIKGASNGFQNYYEVGTRLKVSPVFCKYICFAFMSCAAVWCPT